MSSSEKYILGKVKTGKAGRGIPLLCLLFLLSVFVFLSPGSASAKDAVDHDQFQKINGQPQKIIGFWLTRKGDARVQFYRETGREKRFLGRLAWLRQPDDDKGRPNLDENNPDPALRRRPVLGLVIIHVSYTGRGSWKGTVYDPDNGKTYGCNICLAGPDTMKLRGYLGFSLFGRTETWKRVK